MAIGDYTKTEYSNGGTPAINETNLNNNEDKTEEIDVFLEERIIKMIYNIKW